MEQNQLNEFVNLVARMRHLQKEYFRTKRHDVMIQSCALEDQVDKFIDDHQQFKLQF